jgi:AAA domain
MRKETHQEFGTRIEGMLAMGFLSTIPPLRCAADIESPLARAIPRELCGVSEPTAYDPASDPSCVHGWHFVMGGGLYGVVGSLSTDYLVSERLLDIVQTGKKVAIVGDSDGEFAEMCRERLGDDVVDDWFYRLSDRNGIPFTLSDEDDAMELRDIIATDRIGAVVLLRQEDQLQYLDLITNVPVYRGKERAHLKKLPIFHVQDSEWLETAFAKVGKPVTVNEDERSGCTQTASSIGKEHREWLWPGYLGRNKVAHFGGASTEGKSPVTLDLIARLTSGSAWPDGSENTLGPRSAILLAAEDDWSDTIIPRLELAGADLTKVHKFFVKQQAVELTPSLDNDCQRLEQEIKRIGNVALVVIDPITNYLGSKKMNLEEEIRGGILMPLSDVAKNNNCSIVTVGHLNKRGAEAGVLQRLMGAAAFGGVARDVFIFGPDPDVEDKYAHVMVETRNKSAPQLKYRTEAVKVAWAGKESEVIRVKWCGVSHADVDEVVNAPKQQEKTTSSKAVMLIAGMLRSGAKRKAEIDQALKENGIDPEKLQWNRIKTRCKAESRPLPGKGAGWEWFISTKQEQFDLTQREATND